MMDRTRFASAALCALLTVCLLTGCGGTSASSSQAAPSSSAASAPASSLVIPDSKSQADAPEHQPGDGDFEENAAFAISGVSAAFEPCLGWGPGTAGTSLKSVNAAASLLQWAEMNQLDRRTPDQIEQAILPWYDALGEGQKLGFAEAWPLIRADAEILLTDKNSISGLIEDAGLSAADLPGCSEKNWNALKDVLDDILPETQGEY
ncbi:MAG: hypothetical protein ACI4JC_01955 [Faecalibacterium sp.]